jgi:hypothetical protein
MSVGGDEDVETFLQVAESSGEEWTYLNEKTLLG